MKVVLAEKPSVARDLARVLGAQVRRDGFFEGNGYQVTWAIGHLVGLADTKDYGYPRWSLETLPILPPVFRTKVSADDGLARQYHIIAALFREAEEIIVATDAGREGELIFRYIYQQSGVQKPFRRLWISSYTDKAVKTGFEQLKDGHSYDHLFHAARCRAEADWLVGINATQAYTLRYGSQPPFTQPEVQRQQPLSLGRVQTPVLRLLVDRWQEVQDFKPETYWELLLTLGKAEARFEAKWFRGQQDRFPTEAEGQETLGRIPDQATVTAAEKKPKTERPPQLYDLTELQKDANKRYNFPAQQTLDLAQDLYEKYKTLTYPRTDSRYLQEEMVGLMPALLQVVAKMPAYAPFVQRALAAGIQPDKRFFDDKKVTDHHAIIPTETDPTTAGMSPEHMKIYDLVVRRLLAAFLGNCEKELSEIVLEAGGENFRAKGTMIKTLGWREIYDVLEKALAKRRQEEAAKKKKEKEKDKDKEKEDEEEGPELPYVEVGEVLPILEKKLPQKKTKAPSIHTESSILAMMETAGKELEDEQLREAMKERGLGTPATRAGILELLIHRGYITRDKKKLIPTEKGVALIGLVRERPISSAELTGEWESRLHQIQRGEYDPGKFIAEVRQYTTRIIYEVKGIVPPPPAMPGWTLEEVTCPKCGKGHLIRGKAAFGCSRWREGCDFTFKPLIAGKMVEKEHLLDLFRNGSTTQFVQGFTNRQGKRFDARLKWEEGYKVGFFFGKGEIPAG